MERLLIDGGAVLSGEGKPGEEFSFKDVCSSPVGR